MSLTKRAAHAASMAAGHLDIGELASFLTCDLATSWKVTDDGNKVRLPDVYHS
jgi:hypothetical protein